MSAIPEDLQWDKQEEAAGLMFPESGLYMVKGQSGVKRVLF